MADEKISISTGKDTWPELVAVKSRTAELIIKKENSKVKRVEVFLAGTAVTEDFRLDRVRLFTNIQDHVVEIPKIG